MRYGLLSLDFTFNYHQDDFDEVDTNDDGFVDVDELKAVMDNNTEGEVSVIIVKGYLESADSNNDGVLSSGGN